ncbi:MAG TPA: type II toxin-antitoxin system VapC family toxin [Bryobacteraceae bacterium]|nr:type II toxin-antitoxin system VapC family toxin [Bryobacteraceae bacterium]
MRAIDTNVVVRLIIRDNPAQSASAEAFIENGAWLSLLALAETVWVLGFSYQMDAAAQAEAIGMLLKHRSIVLQDAEAVEAALRSFRSRPSVGFSDWLLLEIARKAGHLPLGTFDRALGRADGAHRL